MIWAAQQSLEPPRGNSSTSGARLRLGKLRSVSKWSNGAIEADRLFRRQLWAGVPANHMPAGVAPAAVMLQASRDDLPCRRTPLEDALAGGGLTYRPCGTSRDHRRPTP